MKYFLDTEFLEGTQKKTLFGFTVGHSKPTIDLISIGIVSEDNREYYAISKDFNLKEAWNRFDLKPDINNGGYKKVHWIRENVLNPIWIELSLESIKNKGGIVNGQYVNASNYKIFMAQIIKEADQFTYNNLKVLIERYGKTNKEIANEIINFTGPLQNMIEAIPDHMAYPEQTRLDRTNPKFYAYYADYDWVVFCWLFGKMIDLPKGFPMYCKDLKQYSDAVEAKNASIKGAIKKLKDHPDYPKQVDEHNALSDAKWNKKLYEFLNNF